MSLLERVSTVAACCLGLVACEEDEPQASLLPESYPAGFTEVRDCRFSAEHELKNIRILADASGTSTFQTEDYPFELGALVVKEEFRDPECTQLEGYTLMERRGPGDDEAIDGWVWQRLDAAGRWIGPDDPTGCVSCHRACTHGRDGVCADP
jgi:hypothetical protein